MLSRLAADLRFAWRSLRAHPLALVSAIVVLALGIGATSTIFSFAWGMLVRPLPYRAADRLVQIWETRGADGLLEAAPANWLDWRRDSRTLSSLAAYRGVSLNLTGDQQPDRLGGARVSADFFATLGVVPELGRAFRDQEERPGEDRVVLLSHAAWQRRFAGDPKIVGDSVLLDGVRRVVVGVLPESFAFLPLWRAEVFVPLALDPTETTDRDEHWLYTVGRLAPTSELSAARQELTALAGQLARRYPATNTGAGTAVVPLRDELVGPVRPALLVLLVAVGLVLLLACANVAVLLLARAAARQREVAVRISVGARRRQLVVQLLVESLLLAVLGGLAGVLVAYVGIRFLVSLIPPDLAGVVTAVFPIELSPAVLAFTLALSVVTAIVFGIWPALQGSRPDLQQILKEGGARAGHAARLRGRSVLVTVELVLAVVLLAVAGLLVRSFLALQDVAPGFAAERVLTAAIELPEAAYPTPERRRALLEGLLAEVAAVPGVERAGAVSILPLELRNQGTGLLVPGETPGSVERPPSASYLTATPGYFDTLGIEMLRGEGFESSGGADAPPVVVVNRSLAERLWPGGEAVGQQLILTRLDPVPRTVVGVAADVRYGRLGGPMPSTVYVPYLQDPRADMVLVLRAAGRPEDLIPAVRQRIWSVDDTLPVVPRGMDAVLGDSIAQARLPVPPLVIFAVIALVLAAAGVYGVISYSVQQRGHEIGVRMALGAARRDVLRMVLWQAAKLTLAGLVIGLLGSLALGRLLAGVLYGISATDPVIVVAIPLFLLLLTFAASYLPAWRATRIDPASALRQG